MMTIAILEVKGIGPATAETLAGHGFKTARELARAKVDQLTALSGFSETRAAQVILEAQKLIVVPEKEAADQVITEPESQKSKKNKSKKQKDKKQKQSAKEKKKSAKKVKDEKKDKKSKSKTKKKK